jgi:hypothetical protein
MKDNYRELTRSLAPYPFQVSVEFLKICFKNKENNPIGLSVLEAFCKKARKCIEGSIQIKLHRKITISLQKIIMTNPSIQHAMRVTQGDREN